MSAGLYDVGQVCLNGHVTTAVLQRYPERGASFCATCGAKTITACPDCNAPIRGDYHMRGYESVKKFAKPAYCYNCGKAFPWTAIGLDAAKKLTDEFENLNEAEKEQLKASLPDLVTETPQTPIAESRFKKLMKKAGVDAYDGMKKVLTDIVAEAVKKTIFGP